MIYKEPQSKQNPLKVHRIVILWILNEVWDSLLVTVVRLNLAWDSYWVLDSYFQNPSENLIIKWLIFSSYIFIIFKYKFSVANEESHIFYILPEPWLTYPGTGKFVYKIILWKHKFLFSVQELCTIHRLDASKMASEWMAFKLSHKVAAIDIDCLQTFEREVTILTEIKQP